MRYETSIGKGCIYRSFEKEHGEQIEEVVEPRSMGERFVLGANNPDIDSFASAIALAYLRHNKDLMYSYKAAYGGTPGLIAKMCMDRFELPEEPVKIDVKEDMTLILVAHNEKERALPGVESANIIELIDNHALNSLKTKAPLYVRCEPLAATSSIIFNMYKDADELINKNIAAFMCAAIIKETEMFKNEKTTNIDKMAAVELSISAGLDLMEFGEEVLSLL